MKSYKLVNPLIIGEFKTTYNSDNGMQAIEYFWKDLTNYITNNVPQIIVTLMDESNVLYHYKISEKFQNSKNMVDYNISEYNIDLTEKQKKDFIDNLHKYEEKTKSIVQKGGSVNTENKEKNKRYNKYKKSANKSSESESESDKSSDTSDSSDFDLSESYYNFTKYKNYLQPIKIWYYTPTLYNLNNIFIPTFKPKIIPYIELYSFKIL
jgi:hypothetical protein